MFFILLGIVLIALLIWSCRFIEWSEHTFACVFVLIIVVAIGLGVFAPVAGFKEPVQIAETELVSLTENIASTGSGVLYVSIDANNVYRYRFEVDSKFATGDAKAYKSDLLSGETVTVVEDDCYTTAKLVTYKLKPKRNFWRFALFASEYEYVFYVPAGTVKGNVTLD